MSKRLLSSFSSIRELVKAFGDFLSSCHNLPDYILVYLLFKAEKLQFPGLFLMQSRPSLSSQFKQRSCYLFVLSRNSHEHLLFTNLTDIRWIAILKECWMKGACGRNFHKIINTRFVNIVY